MRLRHFLAAVLTIFSLAFTFAVPAGAQTRDSTQVGGASLLTPSYCQNLAGTWYAAGQVPGGYYKQPSAPYECRPIPACPGNQYFNTGAESCQCPAGTAWDSAYGTCHAPCGGGTAWNGASCASICPAGTAWNGSSCASICAAGTAWNGSSCASICAAGTQWNGSSCASICNGGQVWNGSSCACPSGQSWNGSACGATPGFSSLAISPTYTTVGSGHTVSWTTFGSGPVSTSLACSGANPSNNTLSPSNSGSGGLAANVPGITNCIAYASNPWGSVSYAAPALTAACPAGTSWSGTACQVAATPASMNGKTLTVNFYSGNVIKVTGNGTSVTAVVNRSGMSGGASCSVPQAGGTCFATSVSGTMNSRDAYNQQVNGFSGGGQGGRSMVMQVGADGSLSFWGAWQGAYSGGNACAQWNNSAGGLTSAQVKALAASSTINLTQQFGNTNGCF